MPRLLLPPAIAIALALLPAAATSHAASPVITTVAGTGSAGATGDGGLAIDAAINGPLDLAVDGAGNVYIATGEEDYLLRRVDAATGIITTYAGNGEEGFSLDGGLATASPVEPYAVAVDAAGVVFFSDLEDDPRIRRVDPVTGRLATVAGGGSSFIDGPALDASLGDVFGLDVDPMGHLFVVDVFPYEAVRRVDAVTGLIATVAGNGTGALCTGGMQGTMARFFAPYDAAVDVAGNLFVAANICHKVFRVDASSGLMTTVAGTGNSSFSGDGGPATAADLSVPTGVDVDASGNVFIADQTNNRVRRVDASTGIITTVAGGGANDPGDFGSPTAAALGALSKVAVSSDGATVYVADYDGRRIRRIGNCGNGSIEPPEECDPGATIGVPGSCCTFNCRTWDNDGDTLCDDGPDPCTNGAGLRTLAKPSFAATAARLRLSGTFQAPAGMPFDPVASGATLTVLDGASQVVVTLTIPAGTYAGTGSLGWSRNGAGTRWKFIDSTGAPGPRVQMTVVQRRAPATKLKVVVRDVSVAIAAGDLPLTVAVGFGGQVQAAGGQCGEASFAAGACAFATNGVRCGG